MFEELLGALSREDPDCEVVAVEAQKVAVEPPHRAHLDHARFDQVVEEIGELAGFVKRLRRAGGDGEQRGIVRSFADPLRELHRPFADHDAGAVKRRIARAPGAFQHTGQTEFEDGRPVGGDVAQVDPVADAEIVVLDGHRTAPLSKLALPLAFAALADDLAEESGVFDHPGEDVSRLRQDTPLGADQIHQISVGEHGRFVRKLRAMAAEARFQLFARQPGRRIVHGVFVKLFQLRTLALEIWYFHDSVPRLTCKQHINIVFYKRQWNRLFWQKLIIL